MRDREGELLVSDEAETQAGVLISFIRRVTDYSGAWYRQDSVSTQGDQWSRQERVMAWTRVIV